jgi:hypothetical protein
MIIQCIPLGDVLIFFDQMATLSVLFPLYVFWFMLVLAIISLNRQTQVNWLSLTVYVVSQSLLVQLDKTILITFMCGLHVTL